MKHRLEKRTYSALGEVIHACQLDNGLELVLIPKTDYHEVLGMVAVRLGSLDRLDHSLDKVSGVAHFLEHKLFELADGQDAMQRFASLGAEANAYTSYHHTAYYFSTTDKIIDNLTLLLEMVGTSHFTEASVKKEQGIIGQEIKMYEDEPDHQLYLSTLKQLYPGSTLANDIAGDLEDIAKISTQTLQSYFDNFYQPNNMVLCLVGPFEVDEIVNHIDNYQPKETIDRKTIFKTLGFVSERPIKSGQIEMAVAGPKLSVGYRGQNNLTGLSSLNYRLALRLCLGLTLGWTSSTYQDWYQKGKIDDSFSIEVEATDAYRFVIITLDTPEPLSMSKHIQRRLSHFEQLPDMTEAHLTVLKQEMLGDFIASMNRLDFIANQYVASWAAKEELFDLPNLLEDLTLDKVLEVGRDFIQRAEPTEFIIFPK